MLVPNQATEYRKIIENAKAEISMRLEIISKDYGKYNIQTLCVEMDNIRNQLAKIQRGLIYLKNKVDA